MYHERKKSFNLVISIYRMKMDYYERMRLISFFHYLVFFFYL